MLHPLSSRQGLDAEIVELLDEDSSFERNDKKIDKKSQQREAEIRNKPAEPAAEQAQNKEVDEDTDSFGFLGSLFDSFSSPAANNAEVKSATPPRPKRLLADEFFGTKGKQRTRTRRASVPFMFVITFRLIDVGICQIQQLHPKLAAAMCEQQSPGHLL
jgi:hypothetical protein